MPEQRDSKRTTSRTSILLLTLVSAAVITIAGAWMAADTGSADQPRRHRGATTTTGQPTTTADPRSMRPVDRPGHLHWIVNKKRPLPDEYVPPDLVVPNVELRLEPTNERMHLRAPAASALERMFAAASADGLQLRLISGFRTFRSQAELYEGYSDRDGPAAADQYSARPGTSEHQTGLAADVGLLSGELDTDVQFGATPEGLWVAANADRFGFIVRYPGGEQRITGYMYEPWHLRYVGKRLATTLHRTGETMEEHFGIPPSQPSTSVPSAPTSS